MSINNKIYFPNLNGIRFIAAFLVIIHHVEQIKDLLGMKSKWSNPVINLIGPLGVILFFVLSGFLITYLLLVEEKEMKVISIRSFYIRRVLRIWPLYYLIIGLSFLIIPQFTFLNLGSWTEEIYDNLFLKLLLFIFFLPNLALVLFTPVAFASQTWSVGVEEQFYLIWPVLISKIKNKKRLLYAIVFGYLVLKLVGFKIIQEFLFWNNYMDYVKTFFDIFSIDCMSIGGLFAIYLFEKDKKIKLFFSKYTQIIVYALLVVLLLNGVRIPYIHFEFYAVLFGIIILNIAANEFTVLKLENKLFHYLGKISYGLYMYHPLAIVIILKILAVFEIANIGIQYASVILLTILIAGVSYKYFESFFIQKKIRFSRILSGDNANL